ncbi:MAG: hypothetical protein ACODAG_10585 [Myxococcota bacterium]
MGPGGLNESTGGTLSFGIVGNGVLMLEVSSQVTHDDFDEMLAFAERETGRFDAILVVDPGSGIDARQRKTFSALMERAGVKTAVLKESAIARGAAVAIKWFTPNLEVFSPRQHARAFEFIGHPELAEWLGDRIAAE